jgi:hypothetical protein
VSAEAHDANCHRCGRGDRHLLHGRVYRIVECWIETRPCGIGGVESQ